MLKRDERYIFAFERLCEALDLRWRMHPGVITYFRAALGVGREPARGRHIGDVLRRKQLGVDLAAHLNDVASIDEDRRFFHQDDGESGRACEARKPGEALGGGRDIFVLVLVGARNEKAIEFEARQAPRAKP